MKQDENEGRYERGRKTEHMDGCKKEWKQGRKGSGRGMDGKERGGKGKKEIGEMVLGGRKDGV